MAETLTDIQRGIHERIAEYVQSYHVRVGYGPSPQRSLQEMAELMNFPLMPGIGEAKKRGDMMYEKSPCPHPECQKRKLVAKDHPYVFEIPGRRLLCDGTLARSR